MKAEDFLKIIHEESHDGLRFEDILIVILEKLNYKQGSDSNITINMNIPIEGEVFGFHNVNQEHGDKIEHVYIDEDGIYFKTDIGLVHTECIGETMFLNKEDCINQKEKFVNKLQGNDSNA